ncbi:MAG TPA: nuclear transport factor 2 family protein [Solirubrobacteraceae bacterium]|nr:nuclear transport factor 2 family protein [Solirubrobacteraceae bacterium]
MEERNVQVVKDAYAAFGRGDVEAVLGAMTEDVEWNEAESMPYTCRQPGPQEVAEQIFGPIVQDIEDFSVTPEEIVASGDLVVVICRYRGTGKATGRELDEPAVHVWDMRDGKLARFRQFLDTAKFLEVVPAEASVTA